VLLQQKGYQLFEHLFQSLIHTIQNFDFNMNIIGILDCIARKIRANMHIVNDKSLIKDT
jgi:hypothetical protein